MPESLTSGSYSVNILNGFVFFLDIIDEIDVYRLLRTYLNKDKFF